MMNRTEILKEFSAAQNAAELKKIYFKLLKENHPDKGGDTATCQAINDIYKELADRANFGEFKPFGTGASDEKEIKIEDVSAEMFAAIMAVINLVDLELCGRWLWATGNTYGARGNHRRFFFIFFVMEKRFLNCADCRRYICAACRFCVAGDLFRARRPEFHPEPLTAEEIAEISRRREKCLKF